MHLLSIIHCYITHVHQVNASSGEAHAVWFLYLYFSDKVWVGIDAFFSYMRDRDLWFGLHRNASVWTWYDDTPLSWLNWDDGEPGDNGDCGRLQPADGTWASQGCGTALRYVCERGK